MSGCANLLSSSYKLFSAPLPVLPPLRKPAFRKGAQRAPSLVQQVCLRLLLTVPGAATGPSGPSGQRGQLATEASGAVLRPPGYGLQVFTGRITSFGG